jgi:hypothetical protein
MPCNKLTPTEVQFIESDIAKANIRFSHLEADLLDHICCLVEDQMDRGLSFEKALAQVKKGFNYQTLKNIEIQTILIINSKLQAMKTTLKISGITGFVLFLLFILFKTYHIPGGSMLMLISMIALLFAYIPSLVLTVRRERILKQPVNLFYSAVVSVIFSLLSFVFIMNHWPYQSFLIAASWISIGIFLILLFIYAIKQRPANILLMSVILVMAIFFAMNIHSGIRSQTNPDLYYTTLEAGLDGTSKYFEHNNEALYGNLAENITDSNHLESLMILKIRTDSILLAIRNSRSQIFIDEKQKKNFSSNFLKNYSSDLHENNLTNDILLYRDLISDYCKHFDLLYLDLMATQSLKFPKQMLYKNPLIADNTLLRLECDIRIIENELLQQFRNQ